MTIRVLLIDDHTLFRPGVILLDLNMPGLSGLETLQLLVQDLPESAVVILTVSEEGEELAQALRDGARGYLVKNVEAETLVAGIRKAAAGESVIADSRPPSWSPSSAPNPSPRGTAPPRPPSPSTASSPRASARSCNAWRAARATKRSHATSTSPRAPSRSTSRAS